MIGTFDIEVAKKVWKEKLSADRKVAFEKNDLDLRDAQISGDKKALTLAVARRDELRAIGDKIAAAESIDDLMAIVIE